MVLPSRTILAIAIIVSAACTASAPAPSSPTESSTAAPTSAATASSDWSVVPAAELNRVVLGCIGGVQQTGEKAVLRSTGDGFAGGPTRLRPWIEARGDFGVSATIGGDTENAADLSLYGALPQGEFWRGTKRLDVGLRSGKLVISALTGEKPEPTLAKTFPTPGVSRPASVGVRKIGAERNPAAAPAKRRKSAYL